MKIFNNIKLIIKAPILEVKNAINNCCFNTIQKKLEEIPQLHQEVWNIFASVSNKLDTEQLEQHLADNMIRKDFYLKLQRFTSYMKIALVSKKVYEIFPEKLNIFSLNWRNFTELKNRYKTVIKIRLTPKNMSQKFSTFLMIILWHLLPILLLKNLIFMIQVVWLKFSMSFHLYRFAMTL